MSSAAPETEPYSRNPNAVHALAASPDGTAVAIGRGRTLQLVDRHTGERFWEAPSGGAVLSVATAPRWLLNALDEHHGKLLNAKVTTDRGPAARPPGQGLPRPVRGAARRRRWWRVPPCPAAGRRDTATPTQVPGKAGTALYQRLARTVARYSFETYDLFAAGPPR